jgi:nitroreductase
MMLTEELLRDLVAEARLAPSVHNVQPTRWRRAAGTLLLLDDTRRRLPVADPEGRDIAISHGAALDAMALALARRGLRIAQVTPAGPQERDGPLVPVLRLSLGNGPVVPCDALASRTSWRGAFLPGDPDTSAALDRLQTACDDLALLRQPQDLAFTAAWADRAGFGFLSDPAHRHELLHWMRLSRRHPDWGRDGLNAEAMALSRLEAGGAGLVLGPLFPLLNRLGLARSLTSERAKTISAAAVALLHRPPDEDALTTGRAFHQAWLAMEAAGLTGCPVSVLVDDPEAHAALVARAGIPADRRLVAAFRIGRPAGTPARHRSRLPVGELIA